MLNSHISKDNAKVAEKHINKLWCNLFRGRLGASVVMNEHCVEVIVSERVKVSVTADVMLHTTRGQEFWSVQWRRSWCTTRRAEWIGLFHHFRRTCNNTAVKWHSAVNHISQVLGPRRGFAGYLTLCYTLVTPFVYLDNDGSSVLQPILSKITM